LSTTRGDRYFDNRVDGITIKSDREMSYMRQAGAVVAEVKKFIKSAISAGITTRELDVIAENEIIRLGAESNFKGYKGGSSLPFPATICVSVNDEIVHGIPSGKVLRNGDLVSVDVGAVVNGFHGDSAFTVPVGNVSEEVRVLIDTTREALNIGIAQVRVGARIGDISAAVQSYSEGLGYGVVRKYTGHGIGRSLHEEPQIPNYGLPGRGPLLRKGMALAIEPMLNLGSADTVELKDGWTVVTVDGSFSAHFEETVGILEKGIVEVFTSESASGGI
jgi:methionyl aminopeptidase